MMRQVGECLVAVGLSLGLVTPAYSTDEPNTPRVLVEIRVVQLNTKAKEAGPSREAVSEAVEPETLRHSDTGETIYVAPQGRDLLLEGQVLPAAGGKACATQSAGAKGTSTTPEDRIAARDAVWNELSAPRIISYVGQAAAVNIGAKVPYMVKRPDGSFVLEQGEAEGLHVELQVGEATAAGVRIDRLEVKLTQLVGREPIPDVSFDIGKPCYRTRHMRVALRIAPDKVAIIPLTVEQEQLFILVTARLVESQR